MGTADQGYGYFIQGATAVANTSDANCVVADSFGFGVEREMKTGNIEFEWKVEDGESGGGVFDFNAMEESEAAGAQVGRPKYELIDVEGGWLNSDADGIDDLAAYQSDKMPIQEDWTVIVITDHGVG